MNAAKLINLSLDMPNHKIAYLIAHREMVAGLWGYLNALGLPFTRENHEILVDIVQTRLEGTDAIEREWLEEEYTNFVCYQPETEVCHG